MFRCVFRTKSLTDKAVQVFLTRNQCILNRLCENPILTKCSPGESKYFGARSYFTYQRIPYGKSRNYFFVFGGLLTFLGLKQEEEEEVPALIMTIKRGILCIKRGHYQKAEKTLHDALEMANEEQNEDGITYVYDVLANLYLDTGQIQKAEKLFINVMQRLLGKGYETTDDKITHISLKLAKIYEMSKDNLKAETGYKYCLNNLENKLDTLAEDIENNVDALKLWITTLDMYARFLVNQSRAEEAVTYFKKALDMSVQVNGKEHEDTALLLNDLGMATNTLGDLDSAVSYVKEAAEIGRNVDEMEHLPLIYINLGYLYLSKEMYNESKLACEHGLRFARRDEDKDGIEKGKECLKKIKEVLENSRS